MSCQSVESVEWEELVESEGRVAWEEWELGMAMGKQSHPYPRYLILLP